MFVFVWLRGTLPRIRYDQFMTLGWKILVPISLVWIVLVSDGPGAELRPPACPPARCCSTWASRWR